MLIILYSKSYLLDEKNGGCPATISYKKQPNDHQSTALPYYFFKSISGAMYAGVPHMDDAPERFVKSPFLHKPKSVNFT